MQHAIPIASNIGCAPARSAFRLAGALFPAFRSLAVGFLLTTLSLPFAISQTVSTQFLPATQYASVGDTVSMDLHINGLTNAISMQFAIKWDSTVLRLVALDQPGLPDFNPNIAVDTSGPNNVFLYRPNHLRLTWNPVLAHHPDGFSAMGNYKLFRLHFRVIKATPTQASIDPAALPSFEIRGKDGQKFPLAAASSGKVLFGVQSDKKSMAIGQYMNATPNSMLDVPVRVRNFSNIVGAQGVIQWDPQVLQLEEVLDVNLPAFDPSWHLNSPAEQAAGTLRFGWPSSFPDGVSLPDDSSVFLLRFKVVGALGSGTPVYFAESQPTTYFELIDKDLNAYGFWDMDLNDGLVITEAGSSVLDTRMSFVTQSLFPNPCGPDGLFNLQISLKEAASVSAQLFDASGKVVFSEKNLGRFAVGEHLIEMRLPTHAPSGMYQLALRAANQTAALPLIKQ